MSASVAFITAHKCENDPNECLEIPDHVDTLVFFMGVKNLPKIVAELIGHGKPAQLPVAVIQQGTTNSQKTIVGNLSDITTLAANVQPPAIIIVGEVVRLHNCLNWFENAKYSPMK